MKQVLKRVNLNRENNKNKTLNQSLKVKVKREEEKINKMIMIKWKQHQKLEYTHILMKNINLKFKSKVMSIKCLKLRK